jgi:hypothetical protein
MRLDDLWASLFVASSPPHPASLPVRVPAVEGLLRASLGFASRYALRFATVTVIGSDWLFSSN